MNDKETNRDHVGSVRVAAHRSKFVKQFLDHPSKYQRPLHDHGSLRRTASHTDCLVDQMDCCATVLRLHPYLNILR